VIIEGIDPRDTEWEVEGPVYRVHFWHRPPAPAGVPQEQMMYHSDEYRLSEADDVGEVLDWARTTARPDQTFTLYVEHVERNGESPHPGLIHLMGVDPTVRI
jgi:hypothetical protein